MREYTTAAQDAARIRAAYKAEGWGPKHVSVHCRNFSMGSSVDVTIKSPEVSASRAEQIARGEAESIRRCEITGDILSGGNRYVHVGHTEECRAILARRHLQAIEEAWAELRQSKPGSGVLVPVAGTDAYIGYEHGSLLNLWGSSRIVQSFGPEHLECGAFALALAIDKGEAKEEATRCAS